MSLKNGIFTLFLILSSLVQAAEWRPKIVAEIKLWPLEEVFKSYEAGADFRYRTQAAYVREMKLRTNLVEFLLAKLKKDLTKPDTKARVAERESNCPPNWK